MSVGRAARPPDGSRVAGRVLDLVERILDVRLQIRPRGHVVAAQGVSGIDGKHRLHVQILAPFEEFQQTHAVS